MASRVLAEICQATTVPLPPMRCARMKAELAVGSAAKPVAASTRAIPDVPLSLDILRVIDADADRILCSAEVGGTIMDRKGVNVPDTVIPVAAIGFVVVLFLKELPLRESAHIGMEAIGDDLGVASDPIGDPVPVPEPADTDISASHPNKAKG